MEKKTLNICRVCGLPEEKHHVFEPYIVHKNCKCDPEDWGDPSNIPKICDNYEECEEEYYKGVCKNCEHLKECHME